jgi:hypothetical protein
MPIEKLPAATTRFQRKTILERDLDEQNNNGQVSREWYRNIFHYSVGILFIMFDYNLSIGRI